MTDARSLTTAAEPKPASTAPAAAATAARSDTRTPSAWHVRLLGDVSLRRGAQQLTHLPSRAATALLARLAMAPERAHAREELIELLWPGVSMSIGRNRLRQVLSVLKAVLEQGASAPVIVADRLSLRVAPGALSCDVIWFEAAWRAGQHEQARSLYGGELLPGHFDEWIADERLRLTALADRLPALTGLPAADRAVPTSGHALAGSARGQTADARAASASSQALPSSATVPAYLTRFFGREADSARLRAEVLAHRLVTLVGPGGAGKTRLAAELASGLCGAPRLHWPGPGVESPFDPLLFVPLVTCTSPIELLQALATVVGCEADLAAIERGMAGRHALVVLDNAEHLREAVAELAQSLLARLPRLHLLVTSRLVLGIDGERECVLGTLPLTTREPSLAVAAANPAMALFVDRARAARADFQLGPDNLAAVLALVQALDGMPLALELAAARCRTLSPADMVQWLTPATAAAPGAAGRTPTPALDLLARSGPRAHRDPRQASMERVIAWSWELLPAPAQDLLAALTVFRGGGTVAAVAAVCALTPAQAGLHLDLLVSHSLVQVLVQVQRPPHAPNQNERYGLLELIREFAAARLAAPRAAALRAAQRQWLLGWARHHGVAPVPALIEPELANVHAAVLGAAADGAAAEAMQLALALRDYWELDGMPPHSQHALEQALAGATPHLPPHPPLHPWPTALRCDAHELLAYTSLGAGDGHHALAHADAALALAGDDPARRGRCLLRRVWVELAADYQAAGQAAPLAEVMALAQRTGDQALQARALHQQGILQRYQGKDLIQAEALFAQAQALWAALGNQRLAHARLRNRAQCWAAQGLHRQALASFEQCERAARADGDWVGIIDSTLGAATALHALRRWPEAVAVGRECIRVAWHRHHAHGLAYALWNIVHPLLRCGRPADAVGLMAQASQYWTEHMGALSAEDQRDIAKIKRLAGVRLGRSEVEALWHQGSLRSVAQAVAIALR